MTRIDFYISPSHARQARQQLACRIADKAYQQDCKVYIHADSAEEARLMDELLWTFRQDSFLPHGLSASAEQADCAIVIGHQPEPPHVDKEVLINLAPTVPLFFSQFERVVEMINEDETQKQHGRERYRFYRDRGYELNTHQLKE
ncbi:MAG: DNA polymerase III subunit chi [Gammaproteobacteria bacterium]